MPATSRLPSANDNNEDAGVFTWDLEANAVYADSSVAYLFGLDCVAAEHGLPIQAYLDRVFSEDRAALAKAISEAITSGNPFQTSYRVNRADRVIASVTAFGKCFSDANGNPRFYSGIVVPMPEVVQENSDLRWLCLAALDYAKQNGRADVALILRDALIKLSCPSYG